MEGSVQEGGSEDLIQEWRKPDSQSVIKEDVTYLSI